MRPQPTVKQLKYLVALAEHRHFGQAADACCVTQSTLSAGLAELEGQLGTVLVDRSTRSVALTCLGAEIVERARRILAELDELTDAAIAAREPLAGSLRLGVIPTIGPFLLPRMLPGLRRNHPRLKLFLREDLTDRLVERLHGGALDVLLLALPCNCGDAETLPLFDDPFLLACPAQHPLASEVEIKTDRLDGLNLLLLEEGHCLHAHALSACRLQRPRGAETVAATSLLTLVQMVEGGLGITLLPEMAVASGLGLSDGIAVRPLSDRRGAPYRKIGLAWRRTSAREPEFRLLAGYVTDAARALLNTREGMEG